MKLPSASLNAAGRADLLLEEGDTEGAAVWRAIVRAIEELQGAGRGGELTDAQPRFAKNATHSATQTSGDPESPTSLWVNYLKYLNYIG